jgi:flagellar hook assembly protein FlgD
MKTILISLIILLSSLNIQAADSLVIVHKDQTTEKIPLNSLKKISFITDASLGVKESNSACTLRLNGNSPNPVSDKTTIEFETSEAGTVDIIIYDISGNVVFSLGDYPCRSGKNSFQWLRTNLTGERLPVGIYYYKIVFRTEVKCQKMIVID